MTIDYFYYVYGFLIPIEDCLKVLGYIEENLTPEKKQEVMDECGFDDDDDIPMSTILREWFELEHQDKAYTAKCDFYLGNGGAYKYIIRSFAHDNKEYYDKYYVVGVDVGTMDRFQGFYDQSTCPETSLKPMDMLRILGEDTNWFNALQKHGNTRRATEKEYGIFIGQRRVQDRLFYDEYVCPEVFTCTNDCDCCS